MRSSPLSLTTHLFFLSLLLSGTVVVIVLFIVLPSYREIITIENDIAATRQQLDRNLKEVQLLRRSLQELETVQAAVQTYAGATIRRDEAVDVISTLQSMAAARGLTQSVHVEADTKDALRLSFVQEGRFDAHAAYIRALEQLPYYVVIEQLRWQRLGQDEAGSRARLSFDATLYVRPQEK